MLAREMGAGAGAVNEPEIAKPRRIAAALFVAALLGLSAATPVEAARQCMPRYIAQNIHDAVMAFAASRYCKQLPNSIGEAAARIDQMRDCGEDASSLIDNMLDGHDADFQMIFVEDPTRTACLQAAQISLR